MSTSYSVQSIISLLTGSTTDVSKSDTASGSHTEEFLAVVTVAAAASDQSLTLGGLSDPKVLAVIGGTGITFKLGSAGTDAVGADPHAVIANEGSGLGITEILISNAGGQPVNVTVIAIE